MTKDKDIREKSRQSHYNSYIDEMEEALQNDDLQAFFEVQRDAADGDFYYSTNSIEYEFFKEVSKYAHFLLDAYEELVAENGNKNAKHFHIFEEVTEKHNEYLNKYSASYSDKMEQEFFAKRGERAKIGAEKYEKLYKEMYGM